MRLYVNTYGAKIGKTSTCFTVTTCEGKQEIPAYKVEQLVVATGASITTDALELAAEHNVDVVFIHRNGSSYGRISGNYSGSIATIRRNQLKLSSNALGSSLVCLWLTQKIDGQIMLLRKLSVRRCDTVKSDVEKSILRMNNEKEKLNLVMNSDKGIEDQRNTIMGYDGTASKEYFAAISTLLPAEVNFTKRTRRPASDVVNCMLNYGYAVLYTEIERAFTMAGIDPYIGILHCDNYNRISLVYDYAEKYRCDIEETVFGLLQSEENIEHLTIRKDGLTLSEEGKRSFFMRYNELLDKRIKTDNHYTSWKTALQNGIYELASDLKKEEAV